MKKADGVFFGFVFVIVFVFCVIIKGMLPAWDIMLFRGCAFGRTGAFYRLASVFLNKWSVFRFLLTLKAGESIDGNDPQN